MIGPTVLVIAGLIAGFAAAGPAGAAGGLILAVIISGMVIVGAGFWVQIIGVHLARADARAAAPCPPGFGRICAWAYDRLLPPERDFMA